MPHLRSVLAARRAPVAARNDRVNVRGVAAIVGGGA